MPIDRTSPAAQGTAAVPPEEYARLQGRITQVSRLATIGEMAAGIAHEINQPLTAIANYARASEILLRKSEDGKADVLEALQEIEREARRAADIIRRLRDLVRGQPSERAAADLNGVVTEVAELLQGDARAHGVRLLFELGEAMPRVVVDRVQIQHVLLNLTRNALEALGEVPSAEREIVVRTAPAGAGEVELSVTDTGPGVAPRIAGRLFTPFVTTKPNGTGLGLVSSQTTVRAHDGTLGYRPNSPRGACFFLRLPARPA
jgi:C4-dicarboxylate-specific signal transduction histidine kinase